MENILLLEKHITLPFSQITGYLLSVIIIKILYYLVYNWYLSPLSKIPGPKLSRISNWSIITRKPSGKIYQWFWQMHREYGSVVRVSPNYVLFSSKEAIRQIIVTNDMPKSDSIRGIRADQDTLTLFSAVDMKIHKRRRGLLSPAFSIRYISSLEPLMISCVTALSEKLHSTTIIANKKLQLNENGLHIVNIYGLIQACTLDIIGKAAFGGSFHIVEKGTHPLPTKIFLELKRRVMRHTFPYMRPFLKKDPWIYEFVSNIIKERKELNEKGKKYDDILQILIDVRDEESGKQLTEFEIQEQAMEFLIAGSDTSGYTASMAVIMLLRHPDKLDKLMAELDSVYPRNPEQQTLVIPTHSSLKNLKHLNAVLSEVLRLFPVSMGGVMRQTRQDTMIDGYLIPKNTIIGASIYQVHHSKEIWGVDADEFSPERWLNNNNNSNHNNNYPSISASNKIGYYPFSGGSRNCIGQNFAWMELRLILASLLINFEFEMVPNQDIDITHFITPTLTSKKFQVGVKLRKKNIKCS